VSKKGDPTRGMDIVGGEGLRYAQRLRALRPKSAHPGVNFGEDDPGHVH
jgi:hypothetical protein